MAPRGRKRKAGLMREDAARDAMRAFGFEERLITVCIKELLEVYGEEGWFLIEESSYLVLLNKIFEKQDEQPSKLDEEQKEEVLEEKHEQTAQEEEEKEQQVEDGRDHVGSSSSPATFQTGEASVEYASPAACLSRDASEGYAHHSVGGVKSSNCGWLSEEEEADPDEDSDGDDDEMIQLTPEPLCEELQELFRKIRGEETRKKPTRWDN